MRYKIYYARNPFDYWSCVLPTSKLPPIVPNNLDETHAFVREIEAPDLGDVYQQMQADNWSPSGEARHIINRLGLYHTSLSMGDIAENEDGQKWILLLDGWIKLEEAYAEETETLPISA